MGVPQFLQDHPGQKLQVQAMQGTAGSHGQKTSLGRCYPPVDWLPQMIVSSLSPEVYKQNQGRSRRCEHQRVLDKCV